MKVMALLSSIWLTGCTVFGIRTVEEPAYQVVGHVGAVELRRYEPRIAADTLVQGSEIAARGTGFRRIAGYIFGANHARARIAMTAPVAQASQSSAGRSIPMTAPVAQAQGSGGQWHIRFFMPAAATMQSLPQPDDPLVRLVQEPAETMAVLRFSGTPNARSVARRSSALLHSLDGAAWTATAAPVAWFYDPPWTLPPLRRNEVAVVVQRKPGG